MELIEYADREMMAMDVAAALADEIHDILHQKDRAVIAVPGGGTPAPVYDNLCGIHADWHRVDVLLTDERWVPEDDPRSNTAMLKRHLLVDQAAAAKYHPICGDGAAEDLLPDIRKNIAPMLPIDLLLLGMGGDMHAASLFPNSPQLSAALEQNAPILMPVSVPDQPERVTFTMSTLMGSVKRHVLISGEDKKEALLNAKKLGDPQKAPIAPLLSEAIVHWAP